MFLFMYMCTMREIYTVSRIIIEIVCTHVCTVGQDLMELASQIVATLTESTSMVGPEVCKVLVWYMYRYFVCVCVCVVYTFV